MRGDLGLDAEIQAIQRAMQVAGGINSLLAGGSAGAMNAGNLSLAGSGQALGIASQQSVAANQLQAAQQERREVECFLKRHGAMSRDNYEILQINHLMA